MRIVVSGMADAVVAETALPYGKAKQQTLANRFRGAALDELNSPLQCCFLPGRDQDMKMIRHEYEGVQGIGPLVAVPEEKFDENLTRGRRFENLAALPGAGSHKVSTHNAALPARNCHGPQRLKPPSLRVRFGTAEAVP